MTYSSSHVWSKIRWCMNLTPDQKIQTDETFFIISYSYHPTGALFFSNMFQKTATFSVSRWLSAHVGSTRVFTGVQRETACGHGFRQLLPSDDLDVHQAFQLFPQKMNLEKTLDSIIHCHSVAQEGFKHWLSHSMPGMRKRNSPCWRTHPRHQCLQCVDAKICGPPKIHHVPTSDKFVTYRVRSSLGPLFVSCINQHATGNFGVDFETSPFGMWWVWIWNVILQMRGTQDLSKLKDRKVWVKSLWWISSMWPFVDIASFVFTSSERSFCVKSRSAANSQHTRREEQLGASASSN